MPGAEALQHLQGGSAAGPINIASADLRRPSNVSAASMPGLESVKGMYGSVDGQLPLPLCKSLVCVCVGVAHSNHTLTYSLTRWCLITSHLPTLALAWSTQPHLAPQAYPHPAPTCTVLSVIFTCKCQAPTYHRPQHDFLSTRPFPMPISLHRNSPETCLGSRREPQPDPLEPRAALRQPLELPGRAQ